MSAPIEDGGLYRLGTVCVFGREPGSPAADAMHELAALARLAGSFLDCSRAAGRRQGALTQETGPARVQGWLGVRTLGANRYGHGKQPGLIVLSVAAGSPAARAGLRPTDILHAIDQHVLRRPADVVSALARRNTDEMARVRYQRGGRWLECFVPVSPRASRMTRPLQD